MPLTRRHCLQAMAAMPLALGVPRGADAAGAASGALTRGWHEAVVIVTDADPWVETMQAAGGWEVAWRGRPDRSLNELWQLPPDARCRQWLLRNRGTSTGFMRLVVVDGAAQRRIRAHDQAWETGGIGALDLRVLDIESTQRELERRGWNATADPVRYKTYGFEVIQWAPRSPDGVRLSFVQRISPPLQGWTELRKWSRLTNAAILVQDMEASQRFYAQTLGLRAYSQSNTVGDGGANVMGLPWPVNARVSTDIRGFHAEGGQDAPIELIAMPEVRGRDHSAEAHPPNLGAAALRFRVDDLDALLRRVVAAGVTVAGPVREFEVAPEGRHRVAAVRAPDGVWLEFLQRA